MEEKAIGAELPDCRRAPPAGAARRQANASFSPENVIKTYFNAEIVVKCYIFHRVQAAAFFDQSIGGALHETLISVVLGDIDEQFCLLV